jgi:CHAT domain-containing protein/Flp pilus assembly protein TadD
MKTLANRVLVIVGIILTGLPLFESDAARVSALQQADATLTIHNNSDETICHAFITVRDAASWGRDWLGDDDIAPGTSYSFTLPAGVYEVMLADCKLNIKAKGRRVQVAETQELYYTGASLLESADTERSDMPDQAQQTPCYASASQTLRELLDLYIDIESPLGQAFVLRQVASEHGSAGQHQAALICYLEELAIYQELHSVQSKAITELEGITLNNIGATYRYLGQYQKALTYYLDALDRWQMLIKPANEAVTRDNIGVVYQSLRQFDNALTYHHQALDFFQGEQDVSAQGSALNNIGLAEAYSGHYEEATSHFLKALDIWQKRDEPANEAITLSNLGFAYEKAGRHQEALDRFQQALTIASRLGQRGSEGGALANIGAAYDSLGSYQQALDHYKRALTILQEIGDQEGAGNVLIDIGFTFENLGDTPQALATYRQAIEVIESIQGSIQVESLKSTYAAAQAPVYERLINLLWEDGQAAEAFAYAERARARALLDQIGNQPVNFRAGSAPELIAQEQTLRLAIIDLQRTREDERAKPLGQQEQRLLDKLSADLEQARKDHQDLLTRLKLASPEYAALVSVSTLSLEEVQSQVLDADSTLIEYFVMDDQALAWVVDREGFELVPLTITRADLTNHVERLHKLIKLRRFDSQTAAGLYDTLFAPLKPYIRHPNLIIVPHGVLHYLAFAALWNAEAERYLIEDYGLTYAPSASALEFILDKRSPDQGRLLAMGNPGADGLLLHAGAEAEAVAKLYGAAPLLKQDAAESQVYAQAGQIDLLHLAAHGYYDPYNALYSRIELAVGGGQDGNLEVHEVYGLDLTGANLVVLSACETALGEQSAGDELVGLTRAFLYAGAPAVVTTLWSIDDAASETLMEAFYGHLREGLTNAEALRAAQLEVLAQEQWQTPYYWAAFSLTGDYRGNGEPRMTVESALGPAEASAATSTVTVAPTVAPTAAAGPTPGHAGGGLCSGSAALPLGLATLVGLQRLRIRRRTRS